MPMPAAKKSLFVETLTMKKHRAQQEKHTALVDQEFALEQYKGFIFFSQAPQRAGKLNPRIWLAYHTHVTGPAFYDTAHGPDFLPAA